MRLVLIGYRGTGKSVVAELLAERLNMESVGMDAAIVERAGMPIPEIVEKFGWERFRDIESELAGELSERDNIIIDTGGGVIERKENTESLRRDAIVVWLQASVDTIVERIQSGTDRPALTEGKTFTEEVAEVLERRIPKYSAAAHYEIKSDDLTVDQVADKILEICQKVKIP